MASRLQTQARREASVRIHQEADITTIEDKVSFGAEAVVGQLAQRYSFRKLSSERSSTTATRP
jgi:hypothetical protein